MRSGQEEIIVVYIKEEVLIERGLNWSSNEIEVSFNVRNYSNDTYGNKTYIEVNITDPDRKYREVVDTRYWKGSLIDFIDGYVKQHWGLNAEGYTICI